jgi:hypothetical protein
MLLLYCVRLPRKIFETRDPHLPLSLPMRSSLYPPARASETEESGYEQSRALNGPTAWFMEEWGSKYPQ